MLMGHAIHISFDLPRGNFRLVVGKCHTTKHNSVVTPLIAVMGSADYSLIFSRFFLFFLSWLGEASTGQALDGRWS